MDNEKVKRNREYAERAFWTGHYHFLMQALAVASTHCLVWRSVGEGLPFTLKDIFELAKRHDEEHEISEPSFYYVSREGAIGICPGLEYLTQWLFIPMEPGEERDSLLNELREKLREEEAMEEAVNKAITEGLEQEKKSAIYYIMDNGRQEGPFNVQQLMHRHVTADTLVWADGMSTWVKAGEVSDIMIALSPAGPAAAAASVSQAGDPQTEAPLYYMIGKDNQQTGPHTVDELLRVGLTPESLVWTEGMAQWTRAAEVPLVAAAITAATAPPQQAPIPPQGASAHVRYYMLDKENRQVGPFTIDEMLRAGLMPDSLVWTEGMAQWMRASEVPLIAVALRHG